MFEQRLVDLASRLDGLVFASLVASDGIRVESHTATADLADLDTDNLAVELLTQLKAISANHDELGFGEVTEYSVSTDRFSVMLGRVAPGYYLMLVLTNGNSFGRGRFELRRAPLAFEEDLL
jgi:predicted regulator of Ras-like GTPase activity (Roadblock/LC7/MglB family)